MRFSVSVPVLSKQTVLTEASVSTASSRRMRTSCSRSAATPTVCAVVAIIGKPSGMDATASDSAERAICRAAKPRQYPIARSSRPAPPASQVS